MANGMDGQAAYLEVFKCALASAAPGASRLLRKPEVKERLAELQAEAAGRNQITVDDQLAKLEEIRVAGMKEGEKGGLSAAVRAVEVQSKHLGFMVDRVQISTESMTDAELAEAIKSEQAGSVIPWDEVLRKSRGGK